MKVAKHGIKHNDWKPPTRAKCPNCFCVIQNITNKDTTGNYEIGDQKVRFLTCPECQNTIALR